MKIIVLAGIELTPERFPHLYKIALTNPIGLKERLMDLDKASGGKSDLLSAAINLEHDLAHG